MQIEIDDQFRGYIPKISDDEFRQLEKNILANGCRDPLVLWGRILLDGHNRYSICLTHCIQFSTASIDLNNRDEAMAWMIRNQFGRRNISLYQRATLALLLKPIVAAEAKTRQAEAGRDKLSQNSDEASNDLRTSSIIAKEAGVSRDTIDRVEYITKNATDEIKNDLKNSDTTINRAYTATRRHVQDEENKLTGSGEVLKTTGKYDVIVLDPPWPMQKIDRDVAPSQTSFPYPTMSESQLEDLHIPFDDNCHLFVWTTQKFLPMALRLLPVWSAKYVLTFVWHKPGGFQPFGLPQYNCEFVVYGRVGTPKFSQLSAFPTCFDAHRGEHSEKPSFFYEMIQRVADGRRLDMFSRRDIAGFDSWGNEAR